MTKGQPRPRGSLTVQCIVDEAKALADEEGLAGLTMRALGRRLGVEGMAVYHYVAGKEALLDALVDSVFDEIARPAGDWRAGLRERSLSQRAALRRHPWAIGLVESRTRPGPGVLAHQDQVIGFLLGHGFSPRAAVQSVGFLDAYVYGFVVQEVHLPTDPAPIIDAVRARRPSSAPAAWDTRGAAEPVPSAYPNLEAVITNVIDEAFSFGDDFELGLDLMIRGLERLRHGDRDAGDVD